MESKQMIVKALLKTDLLFRKYQELAHIVQNEWWSTTMVDRNVRLPRRDFQRIGTLTSVSELSDSRTVCKPSLSWLLESKLAAADPCGIPLSPEVISILDEGREAPTVPS